MFGVWYRVSRLKTAVQIQSNSRTIHASAFRAAKVSKPTSKKAPKQQPLEYRTPTRRPTVTSQHQFKPKENPLRFLSIPIVLGSITLMGMSGYMGYLCYLIIQPNPEPNSAPAADYSAQEDVSAQYEKIARTFDSIVDSTEWSLGISSLRRKLVSEAKGDVLEVSIGTGRNLDYYDWNFKGFGGVGKVDYKGYIKKGKVRSFTAVDKSGEMLEIAHEKFSKMFPGILGVRWIIADAGQSGAIPGPPRNANERSGNLDRKYDTVIQTFGLCSVSDPVALLRNLGDCVKEEEGRILLLEHGRGRWEWLNDLLDKSAEKHAKQFGCWWNRDMRDIAKRSGLQIVTIQTPKWWHGGTTWWIELKKPKSGVLPVVKIEEILLETTAKVVATEKIEDTSRKQTSQVVPAAGTTEEKTPQPMETKKKGWW